jgi:NAD-specific glutamate dehydrogenase
MTFPGQSPPAFYQSYVKDIQAKIRDNAALEFSCIWKEHARLGGAKPRALLSDELSTKINDLQTELESSDLFEDLPTRRAVLSHAIPQVRTYFLSPFILGSNVGVADLATRNWPRCFDEAFARALSTRFGKA